VDLFDLSQPLRPGMPVLPGDPPVRFTAVRSHDVDGYAVTRFSLGSHAGTHLDAPRHFFPDGATLDQYPLDRLVGPGLVVDCRPAPGTDEIDKPLLVERLKLCAVPPAGFVLLWSGGALLSIEAAQALLDAGAGLVGTDGPGLDAEPHPVHRLLLSHGVLLAENLAGLERLGPGPVTCAFLPLAVVGTDGAPVRAVAWR
jgi:arylformamidase